MCKVLEHNLETYEKVEEMLNNNNKCCLVLGTCLGKTTTALEYLERHNCRGLVLCPNRTIIENWSENEEVDAISYQTFTNTYLTRDLSKYGIIICDEVHHAGASRWGEGIRYVLSNNVLPVLGLTATNVRADFNDVAETIFENCKVEGLDVLNGIRNGILNGITYVNSYYDVDEIKEQYSDIDDTILLKKLDLAINNTPTVKDILLNRMPNRKIKGIIFVESLGQMDEAEAIIRSAYPKIEIKRIHSKLEDNAENRDWFRNVEEGLILTVNMINEGSHYKGVNTIIMFRKTGSSVMYYQQLGRVMSLSKYGNPEAIVFDFVNNNNSIALISYLTSNKKIREKIQKGKPLSKKEVKERENEIPNQIIIDDLTSSLVDVIEKLENIRTRVWQEWEDDIIKQYYATEGPEGCQRRISEMRINLLKGE